MLFVLKGIVKFLYFIFIFSLISCSIKGPKIYDRNTPTQTYDKNTFEKIDKNQDNLISEQEFKNYEPGDVDLKKPTIVFFGILGVILILLICSGTFYGIKKYAGRKKENIKKNKN